MSEPIQRLSCVNIYLDGWRDVVVLSHGRVWLRGFTASTLELVKLPADVRRSVRAPYPDGTGYSRSRLVRRLRANAKIYTHSKTVSQAIAELGRPARER